MNYDWKDYDGERHSKHETRAQKRRQYWLIVGIWIVFIAFLLLYSLGVELMFPVGTVSL